MLSRILSNTPVWVWGLLAALMALGLSQTRDRLIGLRRILILPVVMAGLSLLGTVSSFGAGPVVLSAWVVFTCLGIWLTLTRPLPPLTRYDEAAQLYFVPGSWVPMTLIMSIFVVKYAVGVGLAMQPAWATSSVFATTVAALYGSFGGLFAGRAARLWMLSHCPQRVRVADAPNVQDAGKGAMSVAAYGIRIVVALVVILVCLIAALIAFGTANRPPPLAVMAKAVTTGGYANLPPLSYFTARDGQGLAYRAYTAERSERIAILIHGSSGDSHAMHGVGVALSSAGVTAYALDMRGH
jgi:hypothetical protein